MNPDVANSNREPYGSIRKRAKQGDADAQFELWRMHHEVEGAPQNYREAAKWLVEASKQNHPAATYHHGRSYSEGAPGFPRDLDIAHKLYNGAALLGYPDAQYEWGKVCADRGDLIYAYMWFNLAAAFGHKNAREHLDKLIEEMSHEDIRTAQDYALTWWLEYHEDANEEKAAAA